MTITFRQLRDFEHFANQYIERNRVTLIDGSHKLSPFAMFLNLQLTKLYGPSTMLSVNFVQPENFTTDYES